MTSSLVLSVEFSCDLRGCCALIIVVIFFLVVIFGLVFFGLVIFFVGLVRLGLAVVLVVRGALALIVLLR